MRHHHAERAARGGIQAQGNVEKPQRHHPRDSGRHGVPRADHRERHRRRSFPPGKSPSPSPATPTATSTRASETRVPRARKAELVVTDTDGNEDAQTHPRFRRRRASCRACTTSTARIASFRAAPASTMRCRPQAGSVVRHQGHHLQEVRPPLQGHLCGDLRGGIQGKV